MLACDVLDKHFFVRVADQPKINPDAVGKVRIDFRLMPTRNHLAVAQDNGHALSSRQNEILSPRHSNSPAELAA